MILKPLCTIIMLMNKKQEIKEVLAESLSKSFLLPIKETLGKNKIPKTIWEDSFLVGFLLTHFSEYMHLLELETLVKLEPEEVSEVIKNSDVKVFMVQNNNQLAKYLKQNMYGKKIVVGMGAGSISNWIKNLPNLMK